MFKYSSPSFQFDISQNSFEYHIFTSPKFIQAFYDNTGKDLLCFILKYIKDKWDNKILSLDIDKYNDRHSAASSRFSKPYIWIHTPFQERETTIKNIIDDLNEKFINELCIHSVPKLITCICKKLESEKYLTEALCEYQDSHGKEKTKAFLHTYFQDIKRTQVLKYEEDSDD